MRERLFDALADHQRRQVVRTLDQRGVADDESAVPVGEVIAATPRATGARLYHVDLPKLADADVVEWDRETGEVSAGSRFDDARRLLRLVSSGPQTGASAD